MRVVIADPPANTPPYDRSLTAALARAGGDDELVTSRFRFGSVAAPEGYEAREWFYPLSSRMGSSRVRLAIKALEHPFGMARFAVAKPDVIHMQWIGAPELDSWLFRPRSPAVLTAHDIVPRRTLSKTALWTSLFGRFERIVVHSERGRQQLTEFGVDAERLRVIPHPAFRSDVLREDDGRTALCLGLIRPYKGTGDAVEAVLAVDGAKLLVVERGDVRLADVVEALSDRVDDELVVAVQLLALVGPGVRPRRVRFRRLGEQVSLRLEEIELAPDQISEAPSAQDHLSSR
jgi:glycosyltransferase involved in cell wall biosynthesis